MGGGDLELKSTFEKWAGGDEADAVAQAVRERHCIHHLKGETGESFG
ncbi:MAG: hypothetical protein QOC61_623, partial [Acidobacteriota bacterium]|nr:hypothetical protein [Acidobacteriota bacterium]